MSTTAERILNYLQAHGIDCEEFSDEAIWVLEVWTRQGVVSQKWTLIAATWPSIKSWLRY